MTGNAFPTHFLDRAFSLYPRKEGIVRGDQRFTYHEFGERVSRQSHALAALGVRQGDRVAYLGANCHRLLEAYYGVVQMGAILVPLNIRLTPKDFLFILNDAEVSTLLVERAMADLIEPIRSQAATLKHLVLLGEGKTDLDGSDYEQILAAAPDHPFPRPEMGEDDTAEIFYTSGTTGNPKGVMLTNRNLYANAMNYIWASQLTDADVQLHTVPLFHVNGWGTPHAITGTGGKHVMIRSFVPQQVFELVQHERVTLCAMVPTMINALVNSPDLPNSDFSSVRRLVSGGAPTPWALAREASEKLGVEFVVGYGLTESSPVLTMSLLKNELKKLSAEDQAKVQVKTGIPVIGCTVKVVREDGHEVHHDGEEVGEIVARGDNVMKGYWRRPEETAEALRGGWLHTGDLATVDDNGYINIVDRGKDIIISGGENISSVEVEDALYEYPAVLEAAVIAKPDPRWGEVVHAIVVLKPNASATEQQIIEHARGRLAHFKAPKAVDIVESLPKTGTGKVQKNALREQYWKGYERRVH